MRTKATIAGVVVALLVAVGGFWTGSRTAARTDENRVTKIEGRLDKIDSYHEATAPLIPTLHETVTQSKANAAAIEQLTKQVDRVLDAQEETNKLLRDFVRKSSAGR